jgi:benzoyl-CoA reductase/2-hydroxyglutaryl-CoA dehydratase subunit BcrC/BadD/HgdB
MADYHEMWRDLGMDLETHDGLCAALPPMFESLVLRQANRPEGMDYFNMVFAEVHGLRIRELLEHKAKGGKVIGTFCIYVPEEVVLALGGIAVGLCSGSQFWVPAGETVLPRNLCPLIKAGIGAKVSRTCPYFQSVDLIVGENTCDGKKKSWEVLAEIAPVHVMDLPNVKSPEGRALFRAEVGRLIARLEELTGRRLTAEGLAEGIRIVEAKREALARLYEARKADPVPVSGLDALIVSQIAFYDDPARFVAQTEALTEECRGRIARGEGALPKGAKRILLTGTPIVIPNWKIHQIIETSGAAVVCEENCTGTRAFEQRVAAPEGADLPALVEAVTDRYFEPIHCACFSPNEGRFDDVVRLAREYGADGVIHASLAFCTTYQVEAERMRKRLASEGIPFLALETDYAPGDEGQLRTRVEAFLEGLR